MIKNTPKRCQYCNKELKNSNNKYCSLVCYRKNKKKKSEESCIKIKCLWCNKNILKKPSSAKKFCNCQCAMRYRVKNKGQWNHNKKHPKYKSYLKKMRDRRGEKNPNFKAGWDWLKAEIKRTVNIKNCEICGSAKNIELHHKDFNRKNNVRDNIAIVCKSCHSKIHNKIKNITKLKRRKENE